MWLENQAKLITDQDGFLYIGLKLAYVVAGAIVMGAAFLGYNYRVLSALDNAVSHHINETRGHQQRDGTYAVDLIKDNANQISRLADALEAAVRIQSKQGVKLDTIERKQNRQGYILEQAFPQEAKRAPKSQ